MEILQNQSLKPFNTFGIEAKCDLYIKVSQMSSLQEVLVDKVLQKKPRFILGGGSNILLQGNFKGLVLHNALLGKTVISEDDESVELVLGAGENWHESVMHCVKQGWGGIENLSLIPGRVGAAPMQNIGAYGVELKHVFVWLEAVEIATGSIRRFKKTECGFGYRESVFKRKLRDRYLITKICLKLQKQPVLQTSYGAISSELAQLKKPTDEYTIQDVSEAVIRIRRRKLPDPSIIGNAGSFFKNPVIPNRQFEAFKANYPSAPAYPAGEGFTKLAAGWLIDQAGWKGYREGTFGVHAAQALVLVNYGGAKGADLLALSEKIQADILAKFGVTLEREVNLV